MPSRETLIEEVKKNWLRQQQSQRNQAKPIVQGTRITIDLTGAADIPRPTDQQLSQVIEILDHPQQGPQLTKLVNKDPEMLRAIKVAWPTLVESDCDGTESEEAYEMGAESANEDYDGHDTVKYYQNPQYADNVK